MNINTRLYDALTHHATNANEELYRRLRKSLVRRLWDRVAR